MTPLALLLASIPNARPGAFVQALQPFVDRHQLAGAVALVADRTRPLVIETVGYSNLTARTRMRADSVFWIASMTKPVTAAALMMLVDEGKVALDDPASRFLPEFREVWMRVERDDAHILLRRPERAVTVRDLLRHTSGLPNLVTAEEGPRPGSILPLALATRIYASTPLDAEPGARWGYSSAGFNAIGRIVEVASGMSFDTFVERRILAPLGMRDTTFSPDRRLLSRLARSYENDPALTLLTETTIPFETTPMRAGRRNPLPAGGLYSTAKDMMRFGQMLLNGGIDRGHRLLSPSAVREMTTEQVSREKGMSYGLGLFTNPDGSFGHNGAYGTIMTVYPQEGRVFVLLMQHATIQRYGPQALYEAAFRTASDSFAAGAKP